MRKTEIVSARTRLFCSVTARFSEKKSNPIERIDAISYKRSKTDALPRELVFVKISYLFLILTCDFHQIFYVLNVYFEITRFRAFSFRRMTSVVIAFDQSCLQKLLGVFKELDGF